MFLVATTLYLTQILKFLSDVHLQTFTYIQDTICSDNLEQNWFIPAYSKSRYDWC